jgi:plastocyanin
MDSHAPDREHVVRPREPGGLGGAFKGASRAPRNFMSLRIVVSMAFVALNILSGCGGGSSPEAGRSSGSSGSDAVQPKSKQTSVSAIAFPSAQATATISGIVSLSGQAPVMKSIDMSGAAMCAALHKTPVLNEEIVAQDGKLANAVVYVKSVNGKPVENVWSFETTGTATKIDQKGCQYIPHVIAIQAGQTVNIYSSDDMAHNVHYMGANQEFSESFQTPGSMKAKTFTEPELGGIFACNVHNWMKAYINVFPHPFFALTDASGAFALPKLPAGEYELAVWHEKANDSGKLEPADTVKIKLGDNQALKQDFTLKVK